MVDVKLADVDWLEVTVLTVIFLMDCVRIGVLVDGLLVDSLALVSASEGGSFRVSKFDFSRSTD